jgi:hypothetical protein
MPGPSHEILPPILHKLNAPDEIGRMLPAPASAPARNAVLDADVLNMLSRLGLESEETLLVSACVRVLGLQPLSVVEACRACRVSVEDIDKHAREIGLTSTLKPAMFENVRRFVQFLRLTEKLCVVQFAGKLQGRTLLGHEAIEVLEVQPWRGVLDAVHSVGYFRSKAAVYDVFLMFGFGQLRGVVKFECPSDVACLTSTEKKVRAIEYGRIFFFSKKKLSANLKRYTNGHTRTKPHNGLSALLAAVRAAAGTEKMRVSYVCA